MTDVLPITRAPLAQGFFETWTLNDPASRNALSDRMVLALQAACARAQLDPDLRGVVLRGAGGHFCAGGSLGGFSALIGQPLPPGVADPLVPMNRQFGELLQALCALPQWLIVAVEGAAMGGGLGLVCCADRVLAHHQALFAAPEVTLGIVPAQIAPFVVQRLGPAVARRWLLSGARSDALSAQRDGLVDDVIDERADDAMDAAVLAMVHRYAATAPHAMAATKRLLARLAGNEGEAMNAVLEEAAQAFARSLRGTEVPQGLAAFSDRRPPGWSVAP